MTALGKQHFKLHQHRTAICRADVLELLTWKANLMGEPLSWEISALTHTLPKVMAAAGKCSISF